MAMKPETKRALLLAYQIGLPILIIVMKVLGKKYAWAKNTHEVLRRIK